ILTIVIVLVAVIIVVAVAIVLLRRRVDDMAGAASDEVAEAVVTKGSISTTVTGSGTITDEDVDELSVPVSLEITDFYVEEGDVVEQGDLIATVTNASLMGAMSDTQEAIDDLDENLTEAAGDTVSSTVTSSVSGRVKEIFVSSGEDVSSVMYRDGALMMLSLDGYMAVDVDTDSLHVNDSVTVKTGSGTAYDGTVSYAAAGQATVLITDDGPSNGETVTVETKSGSKVGQGALYINSPMAITGYTGTVSSIPVSVGSKVSEGTTLLTLSDTETSANYDTLLVERQDLADQLDTLIRIYKEGGICATSAGTVESIDETLTETSAVTSEVSSDLASDALDYIDEGASDNSSAVEEAASSETNDVTVATISKDDNMVITIDVDETDILSLSVGQTAYVTVDSIGDETYEGTVTAINTTASGGSGVTNYSAEITFPKAPEMLSGMSATVEITIEGVEDALIIPVDALHQTSSTAYVYTEYDKDTQEFSGMVEVTTGLANSSLVEITSGLSEGDVVFYTPGDDSEFAALFSDDGDMESYDMEELPDMPDEDREGAPDGGMGGPGGDMGGPGGER
ncbi:MAG: HlyD family efflux transporter periplasmic adaptor subunit, partial [Clostridiales bacterium]|nr:HlyD family efflux transporter periplasmic adaptor subunit [Clostridiales bacterium]